MYKRISKSEIDEKVKAGRTIYIYKTPVGKNYTISLNKFKAAVNSLRLAFVIKPKK